MSRQVREISSRQFITLGVIFGALHLAAVCAFVPPSTWFAAKPILGADHPAHAHRVEVYRSALAESGLPWGLRPAGLRRCPRQADSRRGGEAATDSRCIVAGARGDDRAYLPAAYGDNVSRVAAARG